MDQAFVERLQTARVDAEALGDARAETLDSDIGTPGQLMCHVPARLGFQIERDASLVSVDTEEYRTEPVPAEWWPAARFVAELERFYLDYFCAKIAQCLGA